MTASKELMADKSLVGKHAKPAGQQHYWKIVKVRETKTMVVVEFENNFVCNVEVIKIKEN